MGYQDQKSVASIMIIIIIGKSWYSVKSVLSENLTYQATLFGVKLFVCSVMSDFCSIMATCLRYLLLSTTII